jgi:phenylacetate-CoA ligase
MGITFAGDLDRTHHRAGAVPVTGAIPIVGTARVLLQLGAGLLAIALVRAAASTVGRHPAGLALLGRSGGRLAEFAGPVAAVLTAAKARRTVPAYRAASRAGRPWRAACRAGRLSGYLQALPVLDKASYVDRYPVAQRCHGGQLPATGIELDESSGSSGRPYQWVRSRAELDQVERGLAVQAGWLLGERAHERVVVLNCFSMGAWATGASVTSALRRLGAIKSCGPEPDKALAAIELLGPDVCYVVCGYPPFLASFLDAAAAKGLDLSSYELWGFVGGEGMTEVLRSRLQRVFCRVLSAYGASDLDIGVAGETELTVALRRAAAADPNLAQALFGRTGRLPMVFQYDPSTYHVETIDDELVMTVSRPLLSPRVRYAVHDAGGTLGYRDALAIARAYGVWLPSRGAARLPLLFVAGRADATLSHMGANLYPEDVDAALGALAEQHPELGLGAFCLELVDAPDGSSTPRIHLEAADVAIADAGTAERVRAGIAGWLVGHNRDWAAAAGEDPRALAFDIRLTAPGGGVFQANAHRIKRQYVLH